MNYTLKDLLDIPKLQAVLDSLEAITSLPSAIIDIEGTALTATARQDICTKFHRANPETEIKCRQSDAYITEELDKSPPRVIYNCPLGLVDISTPIIVEGHHLGNVFAGQLFTEPPDEERFIQQAQLYGFDENDYLAALRNVPVISEECLLRNLEFLGRFAEMLATQGLAHRRQLDRETALRKSERYLQATQLLAELGTYDLKITTGTWESSDIFDRIFGIGDTFVRSVEGWASLLHPDDRGMIMDYFTHEVLGRHHRFDKEYRIIRHDDGAERWLHGTGLLELNAQGQPVRIIGTIQDITGRKKAEEALKLSEDRLETLLELTMIKVSSEKEVTDFALEEAVRLTRSKGGYLHFFNEDEQTIQLYSWSKDVLKTCAAVKEQHYPLDKAGVWADSVRLKRPVIHNDYQNLDRKKGYPEGHFHLVRHLGVPIFDEERIVGVTGVGNKEEPYNETDAIQINLFMNSMWRILKQKRTEEEREKLILELRDALANIRTLSGMLPICASCKKIRDDKGYWKQIEAYITEHSEALFSHGICPECAKKTFDELERFKRQKGLEKQSSSP